MENVFGAILLVGLFCLAVYGVLYEVKHMKAAIAKEQKQIRLYEALLRKLEEL